MKELSIEEKAKAYDEALKVLHKYDGANIMFSQSLKEEMFPELAESKDERIRKAMIKGLSSCGTKYWGDFEVKAAIDWLEKQGEKKEINLVEILKHYPKETELYSPLYGKLWLAEVDEKNEIITCYKHPLDEGCTRAVLEQENTVSFYSNGTTGLPDFNVSKDCMLFLYNIEKQGEQNLANSAKTCKDEQKPADKGESKFNVGDWMVSPNGVYWHIDAIRNGRYQVSADSGEIADWSLDTNIYHKFTLQDAKDGDVLYLQKDEKEHIIIYKGVIKERFRTFVSAYCAYNGIVDAFCFADVSRYADIAYKGIMPASKEQRDLLFQKMKEEGYEWDAEKKELKIIDWSKHIKYEPNSPSITKEYPTWSEEDEKNSLEIKCLIGSYRAGADEYRLDSWIDHLKNRVQPQQEWSEEDYNEIETIACHLDNIGNEGMAEVLRNIRDKYYHIIPQTAWKPSDEQIKVCKKVYADTLSAKGFDLGTVNSELNRLEEELKELKE